MQCVVKIYVCFGIDDLYYIIYKSYGSAFNKKLSIAWQERNFIVYTEEEKPAKAKTHVPSIMKNKALGGNHNIVLSDQRFGVDPNF